MLPIAIVNNPVPVPLVNTTLPGMAIVHVPYDNVAPPISNAQVNNNASPNSEAASDGESEAVQAGQAMQNDATDAVTASALQNQDASAQAAFLAQLLSQDGSPVTQVILVQYEKLAALSNVKYKPSDALKPVPQPSSAFGRILQENLASTVPAAPPPQPQASSPLTMAEEPTLLAQAPAPAPRSATRSATPNPARAASADDATPSTPNAASLGAYAATATRVDIQNAEITTALA